jgi:hypothetical protein
MEEHVDHLKHVCKTGQGVGGNGYRLAAGIIDGGYMETTAINTTKTHPLMLKFSKYPHLHAEIHACIKHGLHSCKGKDILVIRLKKDNNLALAKPCPCCQKFLKHVGIEYAYYSTDEGGIDWLKLS